MNKEEFGKRLRKYRKISGLTQEQLAEEIGIATNSSLISNWERGKKKPGRQSIIRLVEIFAKELNPEKARAWTSQAGEELSQTELQQIFPDDVIQPPLFSPPPPPPLPHDFVRRPSKIKALIDHLLSQKGGESVAITTALRGAGGYGKTTLAQAICHNKRVQAAFPDGILWVTLGEKADIISSVAMLFHELTGQHPIQVNLEDLTRSLAKAWGNRRCLLVVDDVWDEAHLRPFVRGSPNCVCLVTTRNNDTLPPNIIQINVDAMEQDEAVNLLGAGLSDETKAKETVSLRALATRLGKWPIMLKLVNRAMQEKISFGLSPAEALNQLDEELTEYGLTAFDASDPQERYQAVSVTINISLQRLTETERARYSELAIFPEDIDIPQVTLEKLWAATGQMKPIEVRRLCERLYNLSLLLAYDASHKTIRLHDVFRGYLAHQQKDNLHSLHAHLLDAHRPTTSSPLFPDPDPQSPTWADLSEDEPYMWDHLAYHLIEAGQGEELVTTVKDLRYLVIKSYVRNTLAAEQDLQVAAHNYHSKDRIFQILRLTLAQSGHLFHKCQQVRDQAAVLYGHLQALAEQSEQTEYLALDEQIKHLYHLLPPNILLPRHPILPHPALSRTLFGHSGAVTACAFSPDGRYIVSASWDQTLKLWDVETWQEHRTLRGPSDGVTACAYSPDGLHILSVSADGNLKVWDVQTGQECLNIPIASPHWAGPHTCAYSPDGQRILSISSGNPKVWDAETGEELFSLEVEDGGGADCCAYSPDGRHIIAGYYDSLVMWDLKTKERFTFSDTNGVARCTFSPDGQYFLLYYEPDGYVEVWNTEAREEYLFFDSDDPGDLTSLVYSTDGQYILSASTEGVLHVWEAQTGQRRFTLTDHSGKVNGCAFSPDGKSIISASDDGTLKVWGVQTGLEHTSFTDQPEPIRRCAYSPDGKYIVSGAEYGPLIVWNAETGKRHLTLAGHLNGDNNSPYSPDGQYVLSAFNDGSLKVWKVETGAEYLTLSGHSNAVTDCAYSPDGKSIVSASNDGTLKVWDAQTGEERFSRVTRDFVEQSNNDLLRCAYSLDGRCILSVFKDGPIKMWDAQTGQERFSFVEYLDSIDSWAFSPDGRHIISISKSKLLKMWDAETGDELLTFKENRPTDSEPKLSRIQYVIFRAIAGCAYSPDGKNIVSALRDKILKVWDAQTGQLRVTLAGHSDWVTGYAFSPDGQLMASVSADQTLKVWDISHPDNSSRADRRCLATFPVERALNDCAWSPDGRYIVAVGDGGIYFLRFVG